MDEKQNCFEKVMPSFIRTFFPTVFPTVLVLLLLPTACESKEESGTIAQAEPTNTIPVLSFSDGSPWKTDLGSNYGLLIGPEEHMKTKPIVRQQLKWENGNPYLSLSFRGLRRPHQFAGIWLSVWGHIDEKELILPKEVSSHLDGFALRARAPEGPVEFKVEAKDRDGTLLSLSRFDATSKWQEFRVPRILYPATLKEVVFVIESRMQPGLSSETSGTLDIDDVRMVCKKNWVVPLDDDDRLLEWARQRSLRHFIWCYRENRNGGYVLERNSFHDMVSISGMGFAFPAIIIAAEDGLIDKKKARGMVISMLKWIDSIKCQNGPGGWHGFPYHFLKPDGTRSGDSEVGTVDWAICAAGIRTAARHYISDNEISELAAKLLDGPDWESVLDVSGRVSHGFDGNGLMLRSCWGTSFTEESYLVAMEAVASGKVGPKLFSRLEKRKLNGYWPSWFGSGFTYNWLQLWTGPLEPFRANSEMAFLDDVGFCMNRYKKQIHGSTACESFSGKDDDGFLKWDTYLGESGSRTHLAEDGVSHLSVCPYGAALVAPNIKRHAAASLRQFAKLGGAHPLLGFCDSMRMEGLPEGAKGPIPNWTVFSIDAGPMWMAIESAYGNRVSKLYLSDPYVKVSLSSLKDSLLRE